MRNDDLIDTLNKLHRTDPLVCELMGACGLELDTADEGIFKFINNLFLDTADEAGIKFYEEEAKITPGETQSLTDRASAVSAKWRSKGKVDIKLIQSVADAWENGRADVDFVNGKIQVTFTSEYGLPEDIKGLEFALDEIKPAHLPISYLIKYLLVCDVAAMTIAKLESHTINQFAFKEGS